MMRIKIQLYVVIGSVRQDTMASISTDRILFLITVATLPWLVWGNGILILPPARGSAWRAGFSTPRDFTDMKENCGGFEGSQCAVFHIKFKKLLLWWC